MLSEVLLYILPWMFLDKSGVFLEDSWFQLPRRTSGITHSTLQQYESLVGGFRLQRSLIQVLMFQKIMSDWKIKFMIDNRRDSRFSYISFCVGSFNQSLPMKTWFSGLIFQKHRPKFTSLVVT